MSNTSKPRTAQPPPGQLFSDHQRTRIAAALCGYIVLLFSCGIFPLGGQIYARRLGKAGKIFLLVVIPMVLLTFGLEEAAPLVSDIVGWLWILFHFALPILSMSLIPEPEDPADSQGPLAQTEA